MQPVPAPDPAPTKPATADRASWSEFTVASFQRGGGRAVVTVTGPLDRRTGRQLCAHLHGLLDGGTVHLVLDLAATSGCPLDLADELSGIRARLRSLAGILLLVGGPTELDDPRDAAGLGEVFALYATAQQHPDAQRPQHPAGCGPGDPPVVQVRLDGEIDRRHRDRLADLLRRAVATEGHERRGDVVLDALEVRFIDIASIGLLVELAARLGPGRRLVVDAPAHLRLPRLLARWPDPVTNIVLRDVIDSGDGISTAGLASRSTRSSSGAAGARA